VSQAADSMRGVLDERDRLAAALLTAERKAESLTTEVSLLQERLEVAKTELYTELSEKQTPRGGGASQAAELELMRATVEELTASMQASQGKADAAAVTISVLEARLAGSGGDAAASFADGEEAAKVESLQEKLKAVCERLDEMGKQRDVLRDEAATRAAKWGAAAMAASTAAALETSETAEEDAEEEGAEPSSAAGLSSTEALVRQMREAEEVGAGMKQRLEFAQEQVDEAAARHQRLAAMMSGGGGGGTDPADIMGLAKQVRLSEDGRHSFCSVRILSRRGARDRHVEINPRVFKEALCTCTTNYNQQQFHHMRGDMESNRRTPSYAACYQQQWRCSPQSWKCPRL